MMPEPITSAGSRVRALRAALTGADPVRVAAWVRQLSGREHSVGARRQELGEVRAALQDQGGARTRVALASALLSLDGALRDQGETARLAGLAVATLHRELEAAIGVVELLAMRSDPLAEAAAEGALLRWQEALVTAHAQFAALQETPTPQRRTRVPGPATDVPGTDRSVAPTGPVAARFASSLQMDDRIGTELVAELDDSVSSVPTVSSVLSAAARPGQVPGAAETIPLPTHGPTTPTGSGAIAPVAGVGAGVGAGAVAHHRPMGAAGVMGVAGAVGVGTVVVGLARALRAGPVPGGVLSGRVRDAVASSLAQPLVSPVLGRRGVGTAPGFGGGLPWAGSGAVHGTRRSRAEPSRRPVPRRRQEDASTCSGLLR